MGLIMVAEDSPIREILLENGVVLKPVDVAGRMVWTDGSGKDYYKLDSVKRAAVVLRLGKAVRRSPAE